MDLGESTELLIVWSKETLSHVLDFRRKPSGDTRQRRSDRQFQDSYIQPAGSHCYAGRRWCTIHRLVLLHSGTAL